MMTEPGVYAIAAEDYHQDPCPAPSLSASIANILLTQSPQHAWCAHPKLNPHYQREERETLDLGTAAHAYLLQGSTDFEVIAAPDWRTTAAKQAREAARATGKVPILAHRWDELRAMGLHAWVALLAQEPPTPFTKAAGAAEQTLIWREDEVWCRARLDWLHHDHRTVDD